MSRSDDDTKQILGAIGTVSASLTSLTRTVDRMDQRLGNVEQTVVSMKKQTDLIPTIADAVSNYGDTLDDYEQRLKRLEQAAA